MEQEIQTSAKFDISGLNFEHRVTEMRETGLRRCTSSGRTRRPRSA
jgi:hypothetical protein